MNLQAQSHERTKGQSEEQLFMETKSLYEKKKRIEIQVRKRKAREDLKIQRRIFAACRKGKELRDICNT